MRYFSKRLHKMNLDILPSVLWPQWFKTTMAREIVRGYNLTRVRSPILSNRPYTSKHYGE
jgi:hypothetical protein